MMMEFLLYFFWVSTGNIVHDAYLGTRMSLKRQVSLTSQSNGGSWMLGSQSYKHWNLLHRWEIPLGFLDLKSRAVILFMMCICFTENYWFAISKLFI